MSGSPRDASQLRSANDVQPVAQEFAAGSAPQLAADSIGNLGTRTGTGPLRSFSIEALTPSNGSGFPTPTADTLAGPADEIRDALSISDAQAIFRDQWISNADGRSAALAEAAIDSGPQPFHTPNSEVVPDSSVRGPMDAGFSVPPPSSSTTALPDPFTLPPPSEGSPLSQRLSPSDVIFPDFPGAFPLPFAAEHPQAVGDVAVAALNTVPEPSVLALFLLGGIGAVRARCVRAPRLDA